MSISDTLTPKESFTFVCLRRGFALQGRGGIPGLRFAAFEAPAAARICERADRSEEPRGCSFTRPRGRRRGRAETSTLAIPALNAVRNSLSCDVTRKPERSGAYRVDLRVVTAGGPRVAGPSTSAVSRRRPCARRRRSVTAPPGRHRRFRSERAWPLPGSTDSSSLVAPAASWGTTGVAG